jgi:heme/copper-type cytochrome/quinol oxidase subunit 3
VDKARGCTTAESGAKDAYAHEMEYSSAGEEQKHFLFCLFLRSASLTFICVTFLLLLLRSLSRAAPESNVENDM